MLKTHGPSSWPEYHKIFIHRLVPPSHSDLGQPNHFCLSDSVRPCALSSPQDLLHLPVFHDCSRLAFHRVRSQCVEGRCPGRVSRPVPRIVLADFRLVECRSTTESRRPSMNRARQLETLASASRSWHHRTTRSCLPSGRSQFLGTRNTLHELATSISRLRLSTYPKRN
jgi:hypothetical protein